MQIPFYSMEYKYVLVMENIEVLVSILLVSYHTEWHSCKAGTFQVKKQRLREAYSIPRTLLSP